MTTKREIEEMTAKKEAEELKERRELIGNDFMALNSAVWSESNHAYIVQPNGAYTEDMEGVRVEDGFLLVDGDVYSEDMENYINDHVGK